jgi:UDP-N-acetylglucosamine 2-epimerase (non-hydrolysing)
VNSTLAAGLAAVKLGIAVCHLEAGLRSFDRAMPEEHNRVLTDHLSELLLVHSESAITNLQREGIASSKIKFVGNTMIDSVLTHVERARAQAHWRTLALEEGAYVLVTLHRPSLVDDDLLLRETAAALIELARMIDVVFPVHPRTRAHLARLGLTGQLTAAGIVLCDPLGYLNFLGLQVGAHAVITDSGGVQEETSALGIPCFTLRDTTERPVTIELGTNTLLGAKPERIAEILSLPTRRAEATVLPYWDGNAGLRAATHVARFLEGALT